MLQKIKSKLATDKMLHFAYGMVIAQLVCIIAVLFFDVQVISHLYPLAAAVVVGLAVEIIDLYTEGNPEWGDWAATVLGGALVQYTALLLIG